MKKLFTLLNIALVACLMLAFTSCGDNDNETQVNKLTIDGTSYKLVGARVLNCGPSDEDQYEGNNTFLFLLTEGLTWGYTIGGNGPFIYFEAFSTSGTSLDKRTYQWIDENENMIPIGRFTSDSGWCLNNDSDFKFRKGSFTVTNEGDQYVIKVSCEDTNGKRITGYYKGTVIFEEGFIKVTPEEI